MTAAMKLGALNISGQSKSSLGRPLRDVFARMKDDDRVPISVNTPSKSTLESQLNDGLILVLKSI